MKRNINCLILDLGGVILNLNYNLTAEKFTRFTGKSFDEIYSQAKQKTTFDEFERGEISNENFRAQIRNLLNSTISDEKIDEAWNAMLLDLPLQRLIFIEKLAEKYPIYLLSNTNAIHKKAFDEILSAAGILERFTKVFQKLYFSHEVKMRKPDASVFELIIAENNLNAEQILFVDDSFQHIEGANAVGLQTLFLEKPKVIEDELRFLLI